MVRFKMFMTAIAATFVFGVASAQLAAQNFNGSADNTTSAHGYYYAITGGKMPPGQTINGDNATGGTFRYIHDEKSVWGNTGYQQWAKDDWFPENVSIALTLKSGSSIVFDNNGIEDNSYGDYYDGLAQGAANSNTVPGLYRGYSMSNNYDWIYAGYFKIVEDVVIDTLIGYFDENAGLNRFDPLLGYRMNIWSKVDGDLLPVNTGSFTGDIFSSDNVAGTFTPSATAVAQRVFGADYGNMTDDIFSITYVLDTPFTLKAGEYYFSHDVRIIPEPAFFQMGALAAMGGFGLLRLRRRG